MATFLGFNYVTPLKITPEERVFRSNTLSLRVQTSESTASRWRILVGLEPIVGGTGAARIQTHRAVNGVHSSFAMEMPQHTGTEVTSTSPVNVATANSGSSTVSLSSLATFTIPAGRFVRFSNHTKVYQIVETVTSSGGAVTATVYPELVDNISAGVTLSLSPDVTVRYSEEGNTSLMVRDGFVVQTTMDVTEAL